MSRWMLLRRTLVMILLALTVGACGAAPDQASSSSATPAPSTRVPATEARAPTSLPPASPSIAAPTPTEQQAEPTEAPPSITPPESTPTALVELDISTLTNQVYQHIKAGTPIVEIADPQLPLPGDIYPGQIEKYFQVGEINVGLVLRTSSNFMLDLAEGQLPTFSGLLVSAEGAPWRKYLEIRDLQPTDKNNPYYLWAHEGELYLSIVDQNGAGSGEGIMKLVRLSSTGSWEIVGCYYFGGSYVGPGQDSDYFAFSQYLDRHRKEPRELCQNVEIALLP
jgi:hypothetical protein